MWKTSILTTTKLTLYYSTQFVFANSSLGRTQLSPEQMELVMEVMVKDAPPQVLMQNEGGGGGQEEQEGPEEQEVEEKKTPRRAAASGG